MATGIFCIGELADGRCDPYQVHRASATMSAAIPAAKMGKAKTCSGVRSVRGLPKRGGISSQWAAIHAIAANGRTTGGMVHRIHRGKEAPAPMVLQSR